MINFRTRYQIKVETFSFNKNDQIYKYLIWISINTNVNIRNKTKLVEELSWYPSEITSTSAANYPRLQKLVPIKSWDIGLRPYDYMYSKHLIFIFMNIKEHIRTSQKQ